MNRDILERPFPAKAIKTRAGARGMQLSYVDTYTVVRRLNEACDNWCFDIKSLEKWDNQLVCVGRLTIDGVYREAIGVQTMNERGGEDLIKGAASDALKKCASYFGVGQDLYGEDLNYESPFETTLVPLFKKKGVTTRQAKQFAKDTFNVEDFNNLSEEQIQTWAKELQTTPF